MVEWLAPAHLMTRDHVGRVATDDGTTQARLRARADAWRRAFAACTGQRWALYFEDAAEFAAALFGAWHAGIEVWLCGDALPATRDALQGRVDGFVGQVPAHWHPLHPADEAGEPSDWPALDEARTRLVVFTSGSTGTPMAITKSLHQLAREVEALEQVFGAALGTSTVHSTVSHQHIYGLLFHVLWPLSAGRLIATRRFFHEEIAPALARDQSSVLVTSPAHLSRLPAALDWSGAGKHLRAVFSSGGALAATAAMQTNHLLGRFPTEIYGSSETGGIAWRHWQCADPPAWQALPGVQWRIAEDCLEIRSPHLPDMNWWRSQDRVQAVPDGFRLLGRADRIVKIEERRVSLDALERCLCALDAVAAARVLVCTGNRTQLAAVVVPSASGERMLASEGRRAFIRHLTDALATAHDAVARPRRWRFVAALPVNAQGKVTDAALRALLSAERPPSWPTLRWNRTEATEAEASVQIAESLAAFDGHFPQVPILPGVAQLDWAIGFAREVFALPPHVMRVEALKFQNVVRPGAELELLLHWQPERNMLSFRWHSAVGVHASGRVVLGDQGTLNA